MKRISFTTLSLLLTLSFWKCEKDDICADGTPVTPRVVIEFYDATATGSLKNVTNLRVEEISTGNGVIFNKNLTLDNPARYLTNANTIAIPLKSFDTTSAFEFKFNYSNGSENTDVVTFSYTTKNEYISRACGYKTIFQLNPTNAVVLTPDAINWIRNIVVTQSNIDNENEIHVKIYF